MYNIITNYTNTTFYVGMTNNSKNKNFEDSSHDIGLE